MIRTSLAFVLWGLALVGYARAASDPALARFDQVVAEPVTTSIYVGRVALSAEAFERKNGSYVAGYTAKVFPFFFFSETGTLHVDVPDSSLRQLLTGSTIHFTGLAIRTDGKTRPLDGQATPKDDRSGTLKVRIIVSKRIILVFNTTYTLPGPGHPQAQ